jgi:hypothetical protein
MDHTGRAAVHHRTHPLPDLNAGGWSAEGNGVTLPSITLVGGAVMSGPGDQTPAVEGSAAGGRNHDDLRASHADRERVVGTLKAAFVEGRLTGDELDARVGQVYASRTYAELAAVTADIPTELTAARSARDPWRATKIAWRIEYAIFLPGIVAVLLLPGGPRTSVATVVILITVVYLLFWILGVSLMIGSRPAKRPGRQLPPPSAPGIGE